MTIVKTNNYSKSQHHHCQHLFSKACIAYNHHTAAHATQDVKTSLYHNLTHPQRTPPSQLGLLTIVKTNNYSKSQHHHCY
jgi:hypothetical protein